MKCAICNVEIASTVGFVNHINHKHNLSSQGYFDTYIGTKGVCLVCGKQTKYINLTKGYAKHCSKACSFKSPHRADSVRKTNLERYGVANVFQSQDIKERIKKANLEKYGVENPAQSQTVQEKMKKTCLERYGSTNIFSSKTGKDKIKKSLLEKYGVFNISQFKPAQEKKKSTFLLNYGVDHPLKNKRVQDKVKQTNLHKYGFEYATQSPVVQAKIQSTLLTLYGTKTLGDLKNKRIKEFEDKHNCTLTSKLIRQYKQGWNLHLRLNKLRDGLGNSYVLNKDIRYIKGYRGKCFYMEQQVVDFIKSIFSGEVLVHDRKLITPKEVDIYIPSKKLAIEFNGVYWHSVNNRNNKPKAYHLEKTVACEKLRIRLIHITDWEWKHQQPIIKSILSSALGVNSRRIFARKCEVQPISQDVANHFLEENHLQGKIYAKHRVGLFYQGELVQVALVGSSRFKKGETELIRFCSKLNTTIVGGFSKLLGNFDSLVSYVDRSKFTGQGYKGWELVGESQPSYCYYKPSSISSYQNHSKLSRYQCQKHRLAKKLPLFDSHLTETENMSKNGYLKVYDCGTFKFQQKNNLKK